MPTGGGSGEQGTMRQGAGNAISIMGARPTSNNFMIDGTANVDTSLGTPAAVLSVDAIEEFKEQTATYSAEYGFSANQVNLVSKSGTNQFHGTVFGFMRSEKLDARNLFDAPDSVKPPLDQKQFGAVLRGPIIKDKTFFLLNYEGERTSNDNTRYFTVPTPDQLAGRFDTEIVDPLTGQPFPNNTIPQDRFSRMGTLGASAFWPAPNTDAPQGNYTDVRGGEITRDQFTIRLDQDFGGYGRVMVRFTRIDFENRTPGLNELGDRFFIQNTDNWQVAHTWPISNNLLNHFRLGRTSALADQHGFPCDPAYIDALQLTGVFTSATATPEQLECPTLQFGGGLGIAAGGGAINAYTASNQPMWDISNTTTWVKGNHTIKFGADFRRWWLQRDLATGFTGDYTFDGRFTGNPVADMLLGYYSGATSFQPAAFSLPDRAGNPREFNFFYLAPYIQDDWRLSPKLTLNLGLRYDYRNVPYETRDRMGWRDLDNPLGGLCMADQTLGEAGILGDQSYYRNCGLRTPDNADKWKVFAPRVGFAFRPTESGRTVIRGGYGLFFDSAEGREIDGAADIYPYVSRSNFQQEAGNNPQSTDSLFPSFSDQGAATPASNGLLAVMQSPVPKNPRMHQWSLSVQHQLTDSTTVEMNYVGSHGSDLLMRRNINQALPYTPDNPSFVARRPYPQFTTYIDSDWGGTSDYHALNVRAQRRTSNLIATLAYTWGKSLDTKSAAAGIGASAYNGWQGLLNNNAPPENDRGNSDFDVDHRIVASFVWNLPIAQDSTGVKQAVLGGWQVNGIYTWQRGFPMTITAADVGGVLDSFGTNRADVVPGQDPYAGGGTIERWFNTDAFTNPAYGEFGDVARNSMRAPTISNLDFALFKNFYFGPQMTLQLRFESFNAFNHPNLNAPGTNVNAPTYGVVGSARAGRINQLGLKVLW